jgi:Uma2 family endonuclease
MAIDIRQPALHMTWEEDDEFVLNLAPLQGRWTAEQYLLLSDQTNRLIEFTDGYIEVLPMPTENHQAILEVLFLAFRAFIERLGGKVRFAPLRVQIRAGKFREPDILVIRDAHDPRRQNRYWLGADVVAEIVSPDNPERDTKEKRADYAEAGILEYWIVNPEDATITVLRLEGDAYAAHGVFQRGDAATSALLKDFAVRVDAVLDAN